MAADIEVFRFPETGQPIRTIDRDGEPWFIATDVASVLDLGNPRSSLALLDEDEKDVHSMDTLGGLQGVTVVNEPGLYSLILRSRKPEAKAFKRWITHEVLPTIRKTGRYGSTVAVPQTLPQALRAYASEVEAREAAETALAIAEPKAQAWDVLASATGDYSVRDAANMLNRDMGITTGQNRLFALLGEFGMVDRNGRPYATHANHLRMRPTTYEHPHTHEQVASTQLRVTAAGLRYLRKRMNPGDGQMALDLA